MPLLKDRITDELRQWVLANQSATKVRIGSERSLSEKFGVSRLVFRSAVQRLVAEGYLVQKQGSGTYIVPKSSLERIGLVSAPDIKTSDPIYERYLSEIHRVLADEHISLTNVHADSRHVAHDLNLPMLIIGQLEPDIIRSIMSKHRCVVSLQSYPQISDLTQVFNDNYKIGMDAAQRLLAAGYRQVVHLAGPEKYVAAAERLRGFIDGTSKGNAEVHVLHGKMNWSGGAEVCSEFLDHFGKQMPVGVFAANDWMAIGFVSALQAREIAIPAHVAVIGCDDVDQASDIDPKLSTFRVNTSELVHDALSLLRLGLTTDQRRAGKRLLVPADFVERETFPGPTA